tara:strand:- start:182 stop:364 length:183 start_codon:yes stop_codon:yes gene_type:complete
VKIFITEFKFQGESYEGPTIVAESFEAAEVQAESYDVNVIGILDTVVLAGEEEKWKPVLH